MNMKKFEYKRSHCGLNEPQLNALGSVGWELVSVDNGVAYFKRELIEKLEKEDE